MSLCNFTLPFTPMKMLRSISAFALLASLSAAQAPSKTTPRARSRDGNAAINAALRDVSAARIRANIEKLAAFHTRHTLSSQDPAKNQIGAAHEWIFRELEKYSQACGGCLEVKKRSVMTQPNRRIPQPTEIVNVYAILRGTDPEQAKRIYVVTGHYDSRASDPMDANAQAPGANDDASGTAVSMECARVLSKHKFPATIIFLAVAGEEQGLNGAANFAKMAKDEGWQIDAVLNNDIVGGNKSKEQDPSIVRVFSESIPGNATEADVREIRGMGLENDSPSRQLARYIRETAKKYLTAAVPGVGNFGPKMIFRRDRFLRGGDHTAFNEQGFTAIRFTEYREDYNRQHQNLRTENGIEYGDLPKFVDFDYVANVARLNAAVLASLASAPTAPKNVRVLTRQLENDTTLTWDEVPGAAGYEIVWRPTTSSEWENTEVVGNVTKATLKRSKDNVHFAVRSVDRQGNRSLPVIPKPLNQ